MKSHNIFRFEFWIGVLILSVFIYLAFTMFASYKEKHIQELETRLQESEESFDKSLLQLQREIDILSKKDSVVINLYPNINVRNIIPKQEWK